MVLAGCCEQGNEHTCSIKDDAFLGWLNLLLLGFQEGVTVRCYCELGSCTIKSELQ
jgi:hypothetical protein